MYHGRIKRLGVAVNSTSGIFGSMHTPIPTLEELWPYVGGWMNGHVPSWAIPQCPRELESMDLLKHIGPKTEGYICKVDSCAVFGFKFISDRITDNGPVPMVLEIWDDERDIAYPRQFWENFDVPLT